MSISAYRNTIKQTETPRQIERRILSGINANLMKKEEAFRAADQFERMQILSEGLRDDLALNQKFWGALRADLVSDGNVMAAELKASLISISIFMDRQTSQIVSGAGDLGSVIDVNKSIIAALTGDAGVTE